MLEYGHHYENRDRPDHWARTGAYRVLVGRRGWRSGFISRADVADFLVKQIGDGPCSQDAGADELTARVRRRTAKL